MREWLMVLLPLAIILYFVVFPDQFSAAMQFLGQVFFR